MTQPDSGTGAPANGQAVTMFTQDQVNSFNADAKRNALGTHFKEAGFDKPLTAEELKTLADNAAEYAKLKDGEKGEVERLQGQLTSANEKANKVPTLEAELAKARLAADAGLKPRYWKYVEGDDEEAIKASIQETLADIGGGGSGAGDGEGEPNPEQQQQGGSGLQPNPQQGTGGGGRTTKSMDAGRSAYEAKHKKGSAT